MPDINTAKKLVFILTAGIFVLVAMLMFAPIPVENKTMIDNIIMAVVTAWVGAVGYFLGGSANVPSNPADAAPADQKPVEK